MKQAKILFSIFDDENIRQPIIMQNGEDQNVNYDFLDNIIKSNNLKRLTMKTVIDRLEKRGFLRVFWYQLCHLPSIEKYIEIGFFKDRIQVRILNYVLDVKR